MGVGSGVGAGRVAVSSNPGLGSGGGVTLGNDVAVGNSTVIAGGAGIEVAVLNGVLGVVESAQAINPAVSAVTRNARMYMAEFYQTLGGNNDVRSARTDSRELLLVLSPK